MRSCLDSASTTDIFSSEYTFYYHASAIRCERHLSLAFWEEISILASTPLLSVLLVVGPDARDFRVASAPGLATPAVLLQR